MRNRFCNKIKSLFTANPYTIERENGPVLYAYDDKTQKRTFLTSDHTNSDKSLIIHNNKRQELIHICIDGGLIEYGLEDYVGDGQTRGRCDCMIFSDSHLILIEFKMDMNPETSDKGRWRNFSQGMAQIKDFYLYLKDRFAETQEDLQTFYPETNIIPTVCMKYEPESHPKRNVQRNNEKEKFRMATKLKIRIFHQYSFE